MSYDSSQDLINKKVLARGIRHGILVTVLHGVLNFFSTKKNYTLTTIIFTCGY